MSYVLLQSDGPLRTITLNDPERLNALDWPLLDALRDAVAEVAADEHARALLVTGAGRAFCSGANVTNLFGDRSRPVEELRAHLMKVYASFLPIRDLAIPTIAAVHGPAVGAGLNIALACDVIVAGPKAGFGPTFTQIGLHPGGGCTWMLTQRIGSANTAAALYAGDVIGADDALRLGIAQEVADDAQTRARDVALGWCERNPTLMAHVKESLRVAATSDAATSLDVEARFQAESLSSPEFERFAARFAKD
jgi:enoyl-CoA hydratase